MAQLNIWTAMIGDEQDVIEAVKEYNEEFVSGKFSYKRFSEFGFDLSKSPMKSWAIIGTIDSEEFYDSDLDLEFSVSN